MKVQHFDLEPGSVLTVGTTRITVQPKTGRRVRLKVESDEPTHKGAPLERPQPTREQPFLPKPGTPD